MKINLAESRESSLSGLGLDHTEPGHFKLKFKCDFVLLNNTKMWADDDHYLVLQKLKIKITLSSFLQKSGCSNSWPLLKYIVAIMDYYWEQEEGLIYTLTLFSTSKKIWIKSTSVTRVSSLNSLRYSIPNGHSWPNDFSNFCEFSISQG